MINNNNNLFYLFFVLIQLFSECENIIGEQQTLHQFISKRSLQNKTNISDKFTINPLLTKLPMFNDGKNLENKKEINYIGNVNNTDITISHPSLRLFKNNRKSRRRKDEKFKKQKNSIKKLTPVNDNFNELQQFFNATLFNLAIPLDKENIERKETFKNEERRYFDSYWDNKNSRKLTLEENKEEEQQQIPPFEVTDSLKLALSSTKPTTERRDFLETSAKSTSMLIEQEKLNEEGRLYPWERQRGNDFNIEQPHFATTFIFPSSTPPTLTKPSFSIQQQSLLSTTTHSIMPGAHFYVDQHVSRGRFGREPPLKPTFVYDPNVLQSRYGYNGILSQFLPDGRLQRFGTGIVDHRQSGVVQQKMAVLPSESFSPPSFVFIIPPPSLPPQLPLNMAKAISTNSM
uniref:Uncharacterized protein n=1 Tax=Meloidogyne hapla TaxID=6305 RepID=A0A1I8BZ36_MELHA